MADRKISELTALTGANTQDTDVLVIVDTSANETKKITLGELENALAERDFSFGDNDKLVFGAGSDLEIYHDGTNNLVRAESGNLVLQARATDKDVVINSDNGSGGDANYFRADGSTGQAILYHYGNIRVSTNANGAIVSLNQADNAQGPLLKITRYSSSPADSDYIGRLDFTGDNSASEDTIYAYMGAQISDVTDGTEDGILRLYTRRNGSNRNRLTFGTTATIFNEDSQDFDTRIESNGNSNMFFVDAGNNRVGLRTNQPKAIFDVQAAYDTVANITANGSYAASFTSESSGNTGRAQGILISGTNSATRGTALLSEAQNTGNEADFIIATSPSAGAPVERVRVTSNQTTITTTDNGSAFGPYLNLYRDSDTPADSDYLGNIRFRANDDNGDTVDHVQIFAQALDVTDGTVDARFDIQTAVGSTLRSAMNVKSNEVVFNENSIDRDFRVESDNNSGAFRVDGGTGNIGMGTSPHSSHNLRVYENSDNEATIIIENDSATANAATALRLQPTGNNFSITSYPDAGDEDNVTRFMSTASGSLFKFATASTDRMTIHSNGRIDLNGPDYTYAQADSNYHIKLEENNNNAYISNINGAMFLGSGGRYYGANLRSLDSGVSSYMALAISHVSGIYIQGSSGHTAGQTDANTVTHHFFRNDGEVVLNDTGATEGDFRVESNSATGMFFVDAGADQVVITGGGSITAPSNYRFISYADGTAGRSVFTHAAGDGGVVIAGSAGGSQAALIMGNNWGSNGASFSEEWRMMVNGADDTLEFKHSGSTEMMFLNTAGVTSQGYARAKYYLPQANGSQASTQNGNWWKIGRISNFSGSKSAEITIYGTQSYSAGSNIAGKSTIILRANNSATTLEGHFYSITNGNSGLISAAWKNVSTNTFDIYVKVGSYHGFDNIVTTSGTWTPDLESTNSSDQPASSTLLETQQELQLGSGDKRLVHHTGSTTINYSGLDKDFKVATDTNSNGIFVDASENRVGIMEGSPDHTLDVGGNIRTTEFVSKTIGYVGHDYQNASAYFLFAKREEGAGTGNEIKINGRFQFDRGTNTSFPRPGYIHVVIDDDTSAATNYWWSPEAGGYTGNVQSFRLCKVSYNGTKYWAINLPQGTSYHANTITFTGYVRRGELLANSTGNTKDSDDSLLTVNEAKYPAKFIRHDNSVTHDGYQRFNEQGADRDFTIETDDASNMFFVDGGEDAIVVNGTDSQPGGSSWFRGMMAIHLPASRNGLYLWSEHASNTHYNLVIGNRGVSGQNLIAFLDSSDDTKVGQITHNGTSTTYGTTSDHRLKENVSDMTGATDRVKLLKPKRFNFIKDADDTLVDGFLAHEVQTVVPEAVTGSHNEVDADGNAVYQNIDQSKLVPLLVATIKELEARITALENA